MGTLSTRCRRTAVAFCSAAERELAAHGYLSERALSDAGREA